MQTQHFWTLNRLHCLLALLPLVSLLTAAPCACAQDDTVTISAAEFQRMVYSAHLLTTLDEKPELDASLQVLLELHRRNPRANPTHLAGLLQDTTALYRADAPTYIRLGGSRDEILAAYLDALLQVPTRTNFIPANLSLLQTLVSRGRAPADTQADLIHSGSQGLLSAETDASLRQTLVKDCTRRAQGNAAFALAMEDLLLPETLVSLGNTPTELLANTNSPLHGNSTLQTLLALSEAAGDGTLTVSSNQLMTLFATETQTLWDTIHTNLALRTEMNQSQADLLAYLTNQAAIDHNLQRENAVKEGQARTIASASAAILIQSELLAAKDPLVKLPRQMQKYVNGFKRISEGIDKLSSSFEKKGGKGAWPSAILTGGMQILDLLTEKESPEETIVREIGNIKTLIGDLNHNMNYRFDRVDQSLVAIFDTLNSEFDQIEITLDAHGRQIAHLNGDVDQIRRSLLDVQTQLYRIERNLATFHAEALRNDLVANMNTGLGYEATAGNPMAYDLYNPNYFVLATDFYTYATYSALREPLSRYQTLPFGDQFFYEQLSTGAATNAYAETLNYIKRCLRERLALQGFSQEPLLANPQDWNAGAGAWLQLALENPGYFRKYDHDKAYPEHLALIIRIGSDLTNFLHNLTFTSTNLGSPVYTALENFYVQKLTALTNLVRSIEQQYAHDHGFALDAWRQWSATAPRLAPTATEVVATPAASLLPGPGVLSASWTHFLGLRQDGTLIDYGVQADYGRTSIPASATNVLAISAGGSHNLALRPNGRIVAWGGNWSGQANIPGIATNVLALAAGDSHSLALRSDGTVVGWGHNMDGQATGVPTTAYPYASTGLVLIAGQRLSNVMAIATGRDHSLALRSDGTVVGWGENGSGQANGAAAGSNVVAIAGGYYHSLALRKNGTVVAWGDNGFGQTNIPANATNIVTIVAGDYHSLALCSDGTVLAWGDNAYGQTNTPANVTRALAIAAGGNYSLALQPDGSVVGWGQYFAGHTPVPASVTDVKVIAAGAAHNLALRAQGRLISWRSSETDDIPAAATNLVAVAAGSSHSLALKADGTVVAWGDNSYGQIAIPPAATSVVAIAAGSLHNLTLRADGTVVGWGYNLRGQATGSPSSSAPFLGAGVVKLGGQTLTNMVALAAGGFHSLALKADGTIVAWGDNYRGQTNVPASATGLVGIAAGYYHSLALKADGTVIAWGDNQYGQTNSPPSATNVVAIAAGYNHSLALRADGTVIGWGDNYHGQIIIPAGATNVLALAGGGDHSLFLTATPSAGMMGDEEAFLVRGQIPSRVGELLLGANRLLLTNLDLDLHEAAAELSGAKALLTAVLELGLPYTLEQDDVLRGFLYGSESLADLDAARTFLLRQNAKLDARPDARPQALADLAVLRYARFADRLAARLADLEKNGNPEIPRLVNQTLRLLNLLRDAWDTIPPPAMEMFLESNCPRLVLYGEPYAHYTPQYSASLTEPIWSTLSLAGLQFQTNLHSAELIAPPLSGPSRFYRALQPP